MSFTKRYVSGLNPSSAKGLHLGNYLGAVKQHVEFQDQGEGFFFIANLHALNSIFDRATFDTNTHNTYLDFLALGLDPAKCTFYIESDIPAIPYLQTILNNCVTVGEMKRMHAYKDKLQGDTDPDTINMGLFNYPILMAADILVFNPDSVPVGKDQQQHVEICREMAKTFNNRYGKTFKEPEAYIKKEAAAVLGTDGERKMSKTLGNDITIFADEKVIYKQVMGTITDRNRIHPTDPGDPAKNVLFSYMRFLNFDAAKLADYEAKYRAGTIGDVQIKKDFYEHFLNYFAAQRQKRAELVANPDYVTKVRAEAAAQANAIANQMLERVKLAVGIKSA